jgi:hypothetical protein
MGVARGEGTVIETPVDVVQGVPVYLRPSFGFWVVVEGRPGSPIYPVGATTYRTDGSLPDLQVIVSEQLGNGTQIVCDDGPLMRGGVPASEGFLPTQDVTNAINDFGCRFKNASGLPGGRGPTAACTQRPDGTDAFWVAASTIQFCSFIDRPYEFSAGDTLVTARIRDSNNNLSDPTRIIVRVAAQ